MIKDRSDSGARYYVVIVDDYSRYVYASRMVYKSDNSEKVLAFVKWFDHQTGKPVKSCLLYTSPSPRDLSTSRMPSSA